MTWQISPFGNDQFFSSNGVLAVGYKLYTYLAGTTTKEAVAADFAGSAFHTNPIVLNAIGMPPNAPIYLDTSKSYKFVYATPADTDPPVSPIYTADNVTVKDLTAVISEWVTGTTPTYISSNSFSVAGDQRSLYHVGRRVKLVAAGSTVYGVISSSVYGSVTTVTVLVDDQLTISASLNSVFYGLLSAAGSSWPVGFNTGLKTTLTVTDARTNTVNNLLELNAQTTGTPAANIGTGVLFRAESGDEAPSDFGQTDFSASNVTAGLEQTYFRVWLRVAGAVLTEVWRWAATGAFKGIFTHANTADRTYTLPNRDMTIGNADLYMGPSSTGSGSTAAHEGTVSLNTQALSGIHFYTDFTLNSSQTLTIADNAGRLCIVATGTITINGTIDGIGAGGRGAATSQPNANGRKGGDGTSQPGGGGGGGANGTGGDGGNGGHAAGGQGGDLSGGGVQGQDNTGAIVGIAHPFNIYGGGGGGAGGGGDAATETGGAGGNGGASIVLVAPTVILAASAVLQTSGANGANGVTAAGQGGGGGGGGSAGNVYVFCRSYTDSGATFTQTAGTAGTGAGGAGGGAAGRAGVKQINIYA